MKEKTGHKVLLATTDNVAAVLIDFATVLTEEICVACDVPIEKEARVMERISPIIERFRRGKSLEPSKAWKKDTG